MKFDLIVIGGGSAGYAAARTARHASARPSPVTVHAGSHEDVGLPVVEVWRNGAPEAQLWHCGQ